MAIFRQLATILASTTSIVAIYLLCSHSNSHDFSFLASILATPANAESNSPAVLAIKNVKLTQATELAKQYKPPLDKNPKSSQGSGSRTGIQSLPAVTLLIPAQNYAGQTTSGHPTFFWHLSKASPVPLSFTLVEPGVTKPLFEKKIERPKAGINQIEMPTNLPELEPGKLYKWSVSLIDNPKRPSINPYYYSWIQRVPETQELVQKLADANRETEPSAKKLRDRAQIYAQAGQWYNALALLSQAYITNPKDSSAQKEFLSLLNQVGLTQITEPELQQLVKQ